MNSIYIINSMMVVLWDTVFSLWFALVAVYGLLLCLSDTFWVDINLSGELLNFSKQCR